MADSRPIVTLSKDAMGACNPCVGMHLSPETFPFRCELSLAPLVHFWQRGTTGQQPARVALDTMIQEALRSAPALLAPIEDMAVLTQHRDVVDLLMSLIIPPASWEQVYMAALIPYQLHSFYATSAFERLLIGDDGTITGSMSVDAQTLEWVKVTHAYTSILNQVYGLDIEFEYPLTFTTKDAETGLPRYFQVQFDGRFVDITTIGEVPPLTEELQQHLSTHLTDPQELMTLLPPEQFIFRGFVVFNAVEVTEQEVLSSLKRELLEQTSIVSAARFQNLQHELRTLFRLPHLLLGVAAVQGKEVFMLTGGQFIEHGCIFADSAHYRVEDFAGSIYDRVMMQEELLIIDDLAAHPERTAIEEALVRAGMRNLIVAPLCYQGTQIGILELGSPHPGELHAINAIKLRDVLPLFATAVKRSMDELNAHVQAVIKEECTAIHPTVEWKFRQAALPYIMQRRAGLPAEMAPIVFSQIHPLYAISDIRGSSTHRNAAIQADLLEHLRLAQAVLQVAYRARPLPILDALAYHVGKHSTRLATGISSGDEMVVLDFLRRDIEPLFDHIQTFAPEVREQVEIYHAALTPHFGTVYQQRKAFEESVTLINETLSAYLEAEEEKTQAMFPHYFEKHKSDGVEFGIYVGASLVEDGRFDPLYLHNLRLWQLLVMCGLARQSACLRPRLPLPLDTAHLILLQHMPLSIRFHYDEKRFDVDGAYDMRYEIIKKRIDKATIKGSGERLTQPGKIAIVYSQPREAAEYREYIEYLQTAGYLTGPVEEMTLEDLQGVQGLHALRVTVALPETPCEPSSVVAQAEEIVRTLARQ